MPPVVALEELAELAASYSAAHERSRSSQLSQAAAREADAALILSAIDLASVAIDAVAELAAVAQHPQLSAALSKAAIVGVGGRSGQIPARGGSVAKRLFRQILPQRAYLVGVRSICRIPAESGLLQLTLGGGNDEEERVAGMTEKKGRE